MNKMQDKDAEMLTTIHRQTQTAKATADRLLESQEENQRDREVREQREARTFEALKTAIPGLELPPGDAGEFIRRHLNKEPQVTINALMNQVTRTPQYAQAITAFIDQLKPRA